MLTPPHNQNLYQAMSDGWNTASHVCCRQEPTNGCPLRVRSGSLQAQERPCKKAESSSLAANLRGSSSRAYQKLEGNSWVVMILRACTKNQHRGCRTEDVQHPRLDTASAFAHLPLEMKPRCWWVHSFGHAVVRNAQQRCHSQGQEVKPDPLPVASCNRHLSKIRQSALDGVA